MYFVDYSLSTLWSVSEFQVSSSGLWSNRTWISCRMRDNDLVSPFYLSTSSFAVFLGSVYFWDFWQKSCGWSYLYLYSFIPFNWSLCLFLLPWLWWIIWNQVWWCHRQHFFLSFLLTMVSLFLVFCSSVHILRFF